MNLRRVRTGVACLLAGALVGGLVPGVAPRGHAQEGGGQVNFNFDQVDLRLFIQQVGELTGKRFVIDDTVSGKITVVTPEPIGLDEVYPMFLSVMEGRGLSVIEMEGVHRVVTLPASATLSAPYLGPEEDLPAGGMVTKVLKLHHISALELKRALEPMVRGAQEGALVAIGATNHLLLTDTAANLRRLEQIIAELDQPGASRVVEHIRLQHASARDVAAQVMAALMGAESAGGQLARQMQQVTGGGSALPAIASVIPAEHSNSLLAVGTPVQLQEVLRIVKELDVEAPSGKGRLNALFLNYLSAEEAAKNLNELLAQTLDENQRRRISIQPSVANNALIIDSTPSDFEVVRSLVAELDRIPQQVMVEILIAEIALGNSFDLGVELSTIDTPEEGETTIVGRNRPDDTDVLMETVSKGVFPQGLAVGVARGSFTTAEGITVPRVPILVTALAQNRDVKIISNVPLLAQNNREATVSVVENIPILRSTIEGGSGTARDVIQNIDRIDVGVKLKFKPHVNPDNEVTMTLNPSIEAIIDQGNPDTPFTPTIAKREVSTTVTVPDRETIVISGLIRDDEILAVSKVPFLGDIPGLGRLFRKDSRRRQRTNLLIFVTPHIVTEREAAEALRRQLEERAAVGGTNLTSGAGSSGGE